MEQVFIFIFGVVLGVLAIFVYFVWRKAKKNGTSTTEELVGICETAMETTSQKEKRKQKIMDLLEKGDLSNAEIRKELGVSSRTAVRYLDELEAEAKVEQLGIVGQSVKYRKL